MSKKPIVLTNNKLTEIKDADALLLSGGISANGLTLTKEQLSTLAGARSNLQAQIDAKAGGGVAGGFTDSFSLKINVNDSIATPTDNYSMKLNLTASDTNAGQTETVTLKFPQPDFADSSGTPSDSTSFLFRVWLSGSTGGAGGVSSSSNADGQNNGTVATLQTTVGGNQFPTLTSNLGVNVPNLIINSAIYRGWFKSVNTLSTSFGGIVIRSTNSLFADITMFSNVALNTTIDRLDGSFTFDLIAAGVNTLAKLQSIRVFHGTSDAAAGVTPHVLTVDAGCVEIIANL